MKRIPVLILMIILFWATACRSQPADQASLAAEPALSAAGQSSSSAGKELFTEIHGQLQVKGVQLCNQAGEPLQLRGYNTYNLTFCPECVTREAIQSLAGFWGAEVVRATMYVDDEWNDRSYDLDPEFSRRMMAEMVRWTEEFGLYVIVDWHILRTGDPLDEKHADAPDFFEWASKEFAGKKHVIYDICNEPNGDGVDWPRIADYANGIIPIIRKNHPEAVIIVGTPEWSSRIDQVDISLIDDPENLMYGFHFYAASHLSHLEILKEHMHRIPVFAAEWGACEYTGNGDLNFENSKKFMDLMAGHEKDGTEVSVSWAVFSYSDWDEAASMLKPESCTKGEWENMSPTGFFIREYILNPW